MDKDVYTRRVVYPAPALFITEAFSELLGPQRNIVGLLSESNNYCSIVICKGDFPFPFQADISYELG